MITTLRIKNMVCSRCKRVVTEDLSSLDLRVVDVRIGEAVVEHDESLPLERIREILIKDGFDLVEDRTSALVERVKELIVDLVQSDGLQSMNLKLSEYIEQETQRDYRYISTLFSQTAGCTIEKFLIAQKIERVKELLVYDEMSLTDIAFTLGYSSVAYLSNQFKQETGMPPTVFKKDAVQARKGIDSIG
ncbi:MAG TPA: AraC family transcriptional regulator [Candidatus Didemnitutus sp.]|nr:AraC family transcriptional regulator [Candidatus Didemnitutus sp.]